LETDEDYMCPNCVTPWKCNGPHLMEEAMTKREVRWSMLDDDLKADIALELFGELLEEAEAQLEIMGELPEDWTEKDLKAMHKVCKFLSAYYGLPS